MPSLALLGDSVLDNKAYTNGASDVCGNLRELLGCGWAVTLCAIDGTMTSGISQQLAKAPSDATHIVLSLGGNDAIMNVDLVDLPVSSTGQALDVFRSRLDQFERSYYSALDATCALGRKTTVCTIYNGHLNTSEADRARTALMMFNDVILRAAFSRHIDVLDLRLVCGEATDFVNTIEPSSLGGQKIARAIARSLSVVGGEGWSRVFT